MAGRSNTLTNDLIRAQRGEIMKVGYLRKKGHIRKNWLDRWFVLTTEGLYYYKNRTDPKPVGVIPLFGCTATEDSLQRHTNCFTCATAEGKDYPLQASTRDEMLMWVRCMNEESNRRMQRSKDDICAVSLNPAAPVKNKDKNGQKRPSQGDSDSDDD